MIPQEGQYIPALLFVHIHPNLVQMVVEEPDTALEGRTPGAFFCVHALFRPHVELILDLFEIGMKFLQPFDGVGGPIGQDSLQGCWGLSVLGGRLTC